MARSAQSAKKGRQLVWDEQVFVDHAGRQGTRLRSYFSDPDTQPEASEQESPFSFQIYSTKSLEGDIRNLVKYFGGDTISDGSFRPAWEIYGVQPDIFDSVDHQKREIFHRKQLPDDTSSLPPIPKVARDPFSDTRRLEDEPEMAKSVGVETDEIVVLPEKLEMVARRIQNVSIMKNTLASMYVMSKLEDGSWDNAMDEDEGQLPKESEAEVLSKQPGPSLPRDLELASEPGDAVTIVSKSRPAERNLRYIIWVPFLPAATAAASTALKKVATSFSSTLISHLLPGLTIHLEFHIPSSPTLSAIITQHRSLLASRPGFAVGALHTLPNGVQSERFSPSTRNEDQTFFPPRERYETFAVVLDKERFWEEQGVLLVMCNGGRFKEISHGENAVVDERKWDFDAALVLRSAGEREVARRLAMLVLSESQTRKKGMEAM
ncbi:hypothetical protein NA56DRAFT_655018 [Hyaloscypha hepaticicola]|uniref:Uncharacterized protein n=1 Tax=Hyaloscypha hepaticicola TaxID=2082293 RepID=A0A2J6QJI8_9HELO|nr:hypothetical protein NA56DRAFT_655018 [Hyaloscypha hepaticicola]